jgi:hypothetical protein
MDYSQIITTTAQRVAPFVVDAVHGSSVLAARVLAQPKNWAMGQYEQNPIQVAESTTGGDFTGLGNFDTSDVSTDVNLAMDDQGILPKHHYPNPANLPQQHRGRYYQLNEAQDGRCQNSHHVTARYTSVRSWYR